MSSVKGKNPSSHDITASEHKFPAAIRPSGTGTFKHEADAVSTELT
ncbi:hypothetical protein [Jiella avicenniae]|uniref:Uncharacterized protein n=1 Tax=Jiella avicenniae TaxID=2907202 RepID=A0A9X1P1M2_9HYPH|nr:hypothetical protein [Jiella avicenniae]MCE7027643.1 hypothetical protein [Jiella avicenniae]MCE7028685.1 hypothetical protein [Jiella avicenniae]